ncbi:hypothetical protein F4861DRAFT_550816 [Xylaria intraflava]|nr:hypothetical protein F4861DRAFT_550816 [Xylaria intraflava]
MASHQDPVHVKANGPIESPATASRFACAIPGCGKVFRRKEHLTRHLKSHNSHLQYACHICGKRYARSDVFKRHIEFHPQYDRPKRGFVACNRCRETKTKCDEESPCRPCGRRGLQCVRASRNEAHASPGCTVPESTSMSALEEPSLSYYVVKDPVATRRRLVTYFSDIHPIWPFLQPSTVTTSGSPVLLIASIIMLASLLDGDTDHLALFPLVYDEINKLHHAPELSIPELQAMVLCLLYTLCCPITEGIAQKSLKIHNNLVAACRFASILSPQRGLWYRSPYASTDDEDQEPRYRLAFATLRLDAYLTILTDSPPLIRYQEFFVPLSQSTAWATVATEEERCRLLKDEPRLRRKTAFNLRVSELFGVPRPNDLSSPWTRMDYHFILCAIQSGAWEASHQKVRTLPDDMHSRTEPHNIRDNWRAHLRAWASNLEVDCQNYFANPLGDDISAQTLLLWHMTTLKMQGPPDFWEMLGRYYRPRPARTPAPYLEPWRGSEVARVAVWHSAQIAQIVSKELGFKQSTARVRLNPLLIPALLVSAQVVCGYTYYIRGCPLCTEMGLVELVQVFGDPEDDERLDQWLSGGAGLCSWGMYVFSGFPTCRCRLSLISDWFRQLLAVDPKADASLVLFLDELKAGLW